MSIAISKKVPGSETPTFWFQDLTLAIQQILPMWIVSYRISKHSGLCDGTLSYRTVANDLRQEVNLMKPALSGRAARGSFGATYGDAHDSEGDTESSTRGTSTKKNRSDKKKNKGMEDKKSSASERVSTSVNPGVLDCSTPRSSSKRPHYTAGRVCRGCGGNHWIQFCFYLFPDIAPEGWESSPEIEAFVKENLKEDPSILEEAKLRNKRSMVMQNKTSDSTANQSKD